MGSFRRFGTAIFSSFDWLISQVENHEALVNSAISEAQECGARAKARLNRVRADGQNMRKRLAELNNELSLWEERALKVHQLDEKRALECLRRKKRVEKQIGDLEVQEREHASLEQQLGKDIGAIEEKLNQLKQQRNVMRTRQSRAEAINAIRGSECHALSEIDEIFERWEAKVSLYEIQNQAPDASRDELEEEFLSEEEEHSLRQALTELVETAQDRKAGQGTELK